MNRRSYKTNLSNTPQSFRVKFRHTSYGASVENEKDIQRFLNTPENNSVTGCYELTGYNSVTLQTGHDWLCFNFIAQWILQIDIACANTNKSHNNFMKYKLEASRGVDPVVDCKLVVMGSNGLGGEVSSIWCRKKARRWVPPLNTLS